MECVKCVCVWYGAVQETRRWGVGRGLAPGYWKGGVVCYVYVSCRSGFFVYIGRSMYLLYCAMPIPQHLKCTQCSILLQPYRYLIPTVYLFMQISQIQTCLCVVQHGFVSTSPAFLRSSASHSAGPHGRLAKKAMNRAPIAGGLGFRHNLHSSL